MFESFPPLLVAAEFSPNASGGGPAVVRQMLSGWPVERLFWWSCFPDFDRRFGQRVAAHRVATIPRRLYPSRRFTQAKSRLLERLWAPWAAWHLRRSIRAVQPAVVWAIPHSWAIPPLARTLPSGRPSFHLTLQDYPEMNSSIAAFGKDRCRRWAQAVDHLYCTATTRDATSHPMIADLKQRTGCDAIQMLHAALESEDFAYLDARTATAADGPIRIAHAGTIHAEPEFELLIEALRKVAPKLPAPVKLDFFGSHSYQSRRWFDSVWMQEHGNLAEPALRAALRQCTWGFSPMALSDDDPRYNRFSFPTKFIVYLAAGLPVITLGHPENSVMKTAALYRVGLRSTAASPQLLAEELVPALSQLNPWAQYGSEIRRCARAEFDANEKRVTLYQALQQCAADTRNRCSATTLEPVRQ